MMDDYLSLVEGFMKPGGKMEQSLDGFTPREEQLRFTLAVARAYQDSLFLAAEAGTGVGKTYAYLLPALIWAQQCQEKSVISTKTKALQQQIVERDLPELEKVIGIKLNYAEAKGRENFLCWHKYQSILAGKKKLEDGEVDFVEAILGWAERTKSGDRKEVALKQELMKHWDIIAADRNNCQREMCKHRDKCFRLKMIKSLGKANIIVTNHALLLSDIVVDNSILPEFHNLIIDEAHTFIRETFDKLANRFSRNDTLNLLQTLYMRDRRSKKGYLYHLRAGYPHLSPLLDETAILVEKAAQLTRELFDSISTGFKYKKEYNFNHILSDADKERRWFADTQELFRREWKPNSDLLLSKLRELCVELEGETENEGLKGISNALQEIDNVAFTVMVEEIHQEGKIAWLDYLQGKVVAVCSSAVHSGDLLEQRLYQKLDTLVMVSATLAIEDRFDHFVDRSGMQPYAQEGRLETLLEHSPFDYERQACMYVARDMPDPASNRFQAEVNKVLADIFSSQGGQTMVLFTSKQHLQEAAFELRPYCLQHNLKLLVQHEDGEFAKLLEDFTGSDNSILMGVETFWEGIDLKGEVLKCLVIVKLPFRSPSDPYCSAWDRYYKVRGKNSFAQFLLPDAAVRFKQGVGRLIRSETDRGTVVVLDTRLIERQYGAVFKNSIPIKNVIYLPKSEIKRELEHWK